MTTQMKALSIRQPWAYLIIHGGKNIENRDWPTRFRGWCWIHASSTMTKADYEAAVIFASGLDVDLLFPTFDQCKALRGGIVGRMKIGNCVTRSDSQWFCGPHGFVIDEVKETPFTPCKGALGFFTPSATPNLQNEKEKTKS